MKSKFARINLPASANLSYSWPPDVIRPLVTGLAIAFPVYKWVYPYFTEVGLALTNVCT